MSFLKSLTGIESFPLATTGTDNPSLTAGAETQFQLGGLPEMQGNLVWKLVGILLTLTGNLVQSGSTGTRLSVLDMYRALIANMRVTQGFFGDHIRQAHFLGAWLPSIEFVQSGYQYVSPKRSFFPAANGTYAFVIDILVPVNFFGPNVANHHTAMLSTFFQAATFGLTPAAASVLTAMSTGASITSLACKASAWMVLDRQIVLPPGIETNAYQTPYASGTVTNFLNVGNSTGLDGTLPGAGILEALLLTSARGQGGAFSGANLTAFGADFRAQRRTTHLEAISNIGFAMSGPGRRLGGVADAATVGATTDFDGSPHLYTDNVTGTGTDITGSVAVSANLAALQVVTAGVESNLSNAQHVDLNLPLDIETSSGSGNQILLAIQAKRWAQAKKDAAAAYLLSRGIIQAMNGGKTSGRWVKKQADFQPGFSSNSEPRYLPDVWVPTA